VSSGTIQEQGNFVSPFLGLVSLLTTHYPLLANDHSPIKPHLQEIFINSLRNQVADGPALFYESPDVGGAKIEQGEVENADIALQSFRNGIHTAARIYIYRMVAQNEVNMLPLMEGGQVIAAHQEDEFVFRVLFLQVGEGVDGITGLGEVEFDVGGLQFIVMLHRQVHHVQAMLFIQQRALFLERILRTHHEPHLLQVGILRKMVGNDQVARVYGIERAEEKPDAHRCKDTQPWPQAFRHRALSEHLTPDKCPIFIKTQL